MTTTSPTAVGAAGPGGREHLQPSAEPTGRTGQAGGSDIACIGDGTPPAAGPSMPAVVRRLGDRVPVGVLLVVLAGQLLPGGWSRLGWLPVGLGLLVGLPHGAVDHLVPAWARARRLSLLATTGLGAGYVLAAAAMLVVLRAAPAVGLLVFLVLSLLHFGTGELDHQQLRAPDPRGSPSHWERPVGVLAWGGTTVLLPLSVWPGRTRPVLDALAPGAGALLTPVLRTTVTAVVLLAAAGCVAVAVRRGRRRPAAELVLLVTVFLTVPPLVAFAAYFGGWHGVRHVARLLATDPANAAELAVGRLRRPLRRFARQAALPTLVALLALAVLVRSAHGSQALLAADLGLLAALTVPHMLVVGWLDRQPARGLPRTLPLAGGHRP